MAEICHSMAALGNALNSSGSTVANVLCKNKKQCARLFTAKTSQGRMQYKAMTDCVEMEREFGWDVGLGDEPIKLAGFKREPETRVEQELVDLQQHVLSRGW